MRYVFDGSRCSGCNAACDGILNANLILIVEMREEFFSSFFVWRRAKVRACSGPWRPHTIPERAWGALSVIYIIAMVGKMR